jgi:hypothetical protein
MIVKIGKNTSKQEEETKGLLEILPSDVSFVENRFGNASVLVRGSLEDGTMISVRLDRSEAADLYAMLRRSNNADGIRRPAEFLSRSAIRFVTLLR